MNFDDLLGLSVALLQQHPTVRSELQQQWSHVLVDEFQVSVCSPAPSYMVSQRMGEQEAEVAEA